MATKTRPSGGGARRRILVVDDHPVLREGLIQIINRQNDLEVCGVAASAEEAAERVAGLKPDLAIVDLSLKGKSGFDLIRDLARRPRGPNVLVLSMHDETMYAERVIGEGAKGYVMKEEAPENLVRAIREVLDGGVYLSRRMRSRVDQPAGSAGRRRRATTRPEPRC